MIKADTNRRFGVEIEINAFDGRSRPLGHELGRMPDGIDYISNLLHKLVKDKVFIQKWGNNHNNGNWILKPDSSCGIEICTPVMKGISGIKTVCSVVDGFSKDSRVKADSRCSFHVHIDIHDLLSSQIASIINWWIKCEYILMNIVPIQRKRNKYCQLLSLSDIVDGIEYPIINPSTLINSVGRHKYYSLNTFHLLNNKRKTIEFRIMDSSSCTNYFDAKNYLLFLLHFVNITSKFPPLKKYEINNSLTSYSWIDFEQFLQIFCLEDDSNLSEGMLEMKNWLFMRMDHNINCNVDGIFGKDFKSQEIDFLSRQKYLQTPKFNKNFSDDNFFE